MKTTVENHIKNEQNLWKIECNGEVVHHTARPMRFLKSEAARKICEKMGRPFMVGVCISGKNKGQEIES